MAPVRESQVEDLVAVLPQRLHLHTGDAVKETPELPVPRHSRCTETGRTIRRGKHLRTAIEVFYNFSLLKTGSIYTGVEAQSGGCGSSCRTALSTGTHLWRRPATACRSGRLSTQRRRANAGRSPTPGCPAEVGHTPSYHPVHHEATRR